MCTVITRLPDFTAGRTNRVPLEFRDDAGGIINLTGKTIRLSYWISEQDVWRPKDVGDVIYEQEVEGDDTGDVEFAHDIDAFDFDERTPLGGVLDVIEDDEIETYAKLVVDCDPTPPTLGSS